VAVKGSKFTPMRVKPHSPRAVLIRNLLLIGVFLLSLAASFTAGIFWASESSRSFLAGKVEEQQQVTTHLEQKLAQFRTSAEVDRQTIENLRQLSITQKAQLMASERDLRVYKDLLSPTVKSNPLGISFGVFAVLPLKETNHFSYNLTVQKLSSKNVDFTGVMEFTVVGQQAGKSLQLPLQQLSAQVTALAIPLNFKYFQTLEGEMALPSDFIPQTVVLVVRSGDKAAPPIVETQLDWPLSVGNPK
jgi:hypothetical protein